MDLMSTAQLLGNFGEFFGAIAVVVTLAYLAAQIRSSTRATSAQSRHAISEFGRRIACFRAENADRLAAIEDSETLTKADADFLYWTHVQFFNHGETYFHHHEMGLLPDSHWQGYIWFMAEYFSGRGVTDAWNTIRQAYPRNYRSWIDDLVAQHGGAPNE